MGKNRENRKKFRSRFFSFEKEKPRQPTAFQKVRRGRSVLERRLPAIPSSIASIDAVYEVVYLSGDSRPSPA